MQNSKRGRKWTGRSLFLKEPVQNTFMWRGKNNKWASYRREYIDDGKTQKIKITNIGTNKTFSIPALYTWTIDWHMVYKDNLKSIKELTDYDAATDRWLERKIKWLLLPELYNWSGLTLWEFDLNNA